VTVYVMTTRHTVHFADSRDLSMLETASVDLVVTSPPYPMIEMWDPCFADMDPRVRRALDRLDGRGAFELMHAALHPAWREIARVLKCGGIACVNIGDATRKIGGDFSLYSNHTKITAALFDLGLEALPVILWRKQTNAPNKFMGSGMLPAGAYVTLEHEYILIFRKGGKRAFSADDGKTNRRRSAFFWEERNEWFSDVWDFKGARQAVAAGAARDRSGGFPPELAYRLVCMYSVYGDTVLDPFLGTGTTMLASAAAGRNSVGVESDRGFGPVIERTMHSVPAYSSERTGERFRRHLAFLEEYTSRKGPPGYTNTCYRFPVVTAQERDLELFVATGVTKFAEYEYVVKHTRGELYRYKRFTGSQ